MGVPFAEHFVSFVSSQKHLPVKAIAKIERNPNQSKHLETARTTVLDTELDFVNLRSEEYAEDSRIPTEVVSTHLTRIPSAGTDAVILDIWHSTSRCPTKRYHYQCTVL
jgi:hypothetical protein